jgi:16S rRNA (guanine527-N7)-methyltransferase
MWSRHIRDSAQLPRHIPSSAKTLADLGSGAGFPGLILAILSIPQQIHLIESTGKKARFLQHAVDELSLDVSVHQTRIESMTGRRFDVITARALKPLPQLLPLARSLMHRGSFCLFLKGQNVDAELTEAQKYWTFTYEKRPSLSSSAGFILKVTDLKALKTNGFPRLQRRK